MGLLRSQNDDYGVWKDEWTTTKDENPRHDTILSSIEPSIDYDLQVQHQMLLTGADKALIGVLVEATSHSLRGDIGTNRCAR